MGDKVEEPESWVAQWELCGEWCDFEDCDTDEEEREEREWDEEIFFRETVIQKESKDRYEKRKEQVASCNVDIKGRQQLHNHYRHNKATNDQNETGDLLGEVLSFVGFSIELNGLLNMFENKVLFGTQVNNL